MKRTRRTNTRNPNKNQDTHESETALDNFEDWPENTILIDNSQMNIEEQNEATDQLVLPQIEKFLERVFNEQS